ncbi:hypothetical protein FRACA_1510012 [Frankia canadensis]|uniref:Uncharacterized protein n=1 Tax=Frankia canadensis TaxID=1836972 RepID=A0A2I2KM28_9ACTN|nr:hypothetical protein FRACA_1510012 [Frankia canadensis]SOU54011.1 hypothetical protein FRACA_1510012 [Frankia canadensis]
MVRRADAAARTIVGCDPSGPSWPRALWADDVTIGLYPIRLLSHFLGRGASNGANRYPARSGSGEDA